LSLAYLNFLGRVRKVTLACDVVAVKHVARLVAGPLHTNNFGNTSAYHVTDGAPSQIVEEQSLAASG
jgi:hypothetical protein